MRTMKMIALSLVCVIALACSMLAGNPNKGWVDIFDGKTLNGWTRLNGTAPYTVEDGAIVGRTKVGSPNAFLCTDKHYGDFELEFDVQVDPGLNSGVQIRSLLKAETQRVFGPQVEIETSPGKSGYIYGEVMGTGWLSPEPKKTDAQGVEDPKAADHSHYVNGEWNHFRVIAKGPRIQTFLNGQPIADLTSPEAYATHPKGFIGLQVHGGIKEGVGPYRVAWKNIRIRELK